MDFTNSDYYQPSPLFVPSHAELQEEKAKKTPFAETTIMTNNNSTQRRRSTEVFGTNSISNSNSMSRKMDTPSTPGRPVFNFSSVPRKSVPSKWDDAEKWLFNGSNSCHASPAHNAFAHGLKKDGLTQYFGQNYGGSITKGRMSCDAIVEKVSRVVEEKKTVEPLICSEVAFNGVIVPADLPLKDKFTDEIGPFTPNCRYSLPTKEAFLFKSHKVYNEPMKDACTEMIPYQEVKHRDIGTEMTPLGSSTTSRCHTPFKSTSPARHNTPASRSGPLALTGEQIPIDMAQLQECHFAKLQKGSSPFESVTTNWSSREEEEEDISKSLRHFELGRRSVSVSESRARVWEEEEKSKSCLRYRREEAKIQAWINLQTAKAEAQSRKLEVKIQKMRSNLEEKLMKRMSIVERKAEEWREAAQNEHSEQIRKATERARKLVSDQLHQNSHLSPHVVSCGCFPCTSDH
ncbi:hypothetical protein RND81_04G136100 [Saponaria officinalis]|uniref:Remorin C-terminal domain-containing protein n=1 Tax=Saponaria officinalis TaxID=3572 RepID=A0AAW1LLN6_SAPOF